MTKGVSRSYESKCTMEFRGSRLGKMVKGKSDVPLSLHARRPCWFNVSPDEDCSH